MAISRYRFSDHAQLEMARRQISEDEVARVLAAPEQVLPVRPGRDVYQARQLVSDPPKTYLLRVFVDVDRDPPVVVTAYRTSSIARYWESPR